MQHICDIENEIDPLCERVATRRGPNEITLIGLRPIPNLQGIQFKF